jgi:CheY-like chemotaxis protein
MKIKPNHLILFVEDSDEDFETAIRAFKKSGMANPFHRCVDGDSAIDYLTRKGIYADTQKFPRPELILLDLNLPGTDGREVLDVIKANPDLKTTPVIVLTTSGDEKDIQSCYSAGANSYIQKPVSLEGFIKAIQTLSEYWFEVVILPKN